MFNHNYYTYILTNSAKTVLYVGMTNDLSIRLWQHKNEPKGFVKRYRCHHLVYYEHHSRAMDAIDREKQIKRWSRIKKEMLIESINPNYHFLEKEFLED